MTQSRPYTDYKFIGVKPFTEMLEESGVSFTLFDDESVGRLFSEKSDYFKKDEDTICIGKCTHEQADVYFAEFGLKITPSYRSYIVFIFHHHPTGDEMIDTAGDIELLIEQNLEGVDFGDIMKH